MGEQSPAAAVIGPCRNCGRHVSVTATRCRFCGYDADTDRNERARTVWTISGLLATLTVLGLPLGVALLWKAHKHHRAATGRVVDTGSTPSALVLVVSGTDW